MMLFTGVEVEGKFRSLHTMFVHEGTLAEYSVLKTHLFKYAAQLKTRNQKLGQIYFGANAHHGPTPTAVDPALVKQVCLQEDLFGNPVIMVDTQADIIGWTKFGFGKIELMIPLNPHSVIEVAMSMNDICRIRDRVQFKFLSPDGVWVLPVKCQSNPWNEYAEDKVVYDSLSSR